MTRTFCSIISSSRACFPVLTLLMLCCIPGCTQSLKVENPQKQYYVLSAQRERATSTTASSTVLAVKRLNVAPSYASRELVYRSTKNQYLPDYYNLFLVQPAEQLTQAVSDWMEHSGLFGHVVSTSSDLRPDYVLETNVTQLYGDFSHGGAKAVLEIQFFLLQDKLGEYVVKQQKLYKQEVPLTSKSASGLVEGFNTALSQALALLEQDVRQVLK